MTDDADSPADGRSDTERDDTDDAELAEQLYGVPDESSDDSDEPEGVETATSDPDGSSEPTPPGETDGSDDAESDESKGPEDVPFGPGGGGGSLPADAPISDSDEPPEPEHGLFYVKYAEGVSATLHEVNTGQIYTLIENPDFEQHEIVEASLIAQPPMEVSYTINDIESRRTVPVETSPESPTTQVTNIAGDMEPGQAVAIDREGEGEIHILRVESDQVDQTADELPDDEMTYKNAARYGMDRVEIRTDEETGVVAIRYLP
ncbi:DUF5812 family protein [Halovenus marina]|uniref:DUF5812 family protein n=1 Tax=Halovenus marina TaxID=3396621 RepID=UPI003F562013